MQFQFMSTFVFQLPGLILWLIGIALSLYSRPKNPRKYMLTAISFSLMLLLGLANPLLSAWMMTQYADGGFSADQIGTGYQVLTFIGAPFWIIAWILLLIALFNQRYNST